jgi:acyl dehydratase
MAGRYFDEWQVGDKVAHAITRTVTETDNVLITTLTHNPQPLHLDYQAAAETEFGKPLVNSCFTFSLMVGVSVHDTTLGTLVANLGYDKLVFPNPVLPATRCAARANAWRCAKASRVPMPESSPGRTAASTSAMNSCANAPAPRCSSRGRNERGAAQLAVRPRR